MFWSRTFGRGVVSIYVRPVRNLIVTTTGLLFGLFFIAVAASRFTVVPLRSAVFGAAGVGLFWLSEQAFAASARHLSRAVRTFFS
jgi:hypothetical protein